MWTSSVKDKDHRKEQIVIRKEACAFILVFEVEPAAAEAPGGGDVTFSGGAAAEPRPPTASRTLRTLCPEASAAGADLGTEVL